MKELVAAQRQFFLTHTTRELSFRARCLKNLQRALRRWEPRLCVALRQDLGKTAAESYMSELGMVMASLSEARRNLKKWTKPTRVSSPLSQFPCRCRIEHEPYGVVLIMSPWNYPALLSLDPLVAALTAGNCCIVKPSELAPATSEIIAELIADVFPKEHVAVVQGGVDVCQELLAQQFDYIFFTGGPAIGRQVMAAAAAHLTPVTLELGGKSPCIVDETANIPVAARRIAFGKVLNAGQTCVAPDYLMIHESRKDEFVDEYRKAVSKMLGDTPLENETFPHIINRRHYERVKALMKGCRALVGGHTDDDTLRIEPTLLDGVTNDSPCMQEEIFGPLLPMITYKGLEEVERAVLSRPKPLACYIFTSSDKVETRLMSRLSFGGGCVNDTIVHLAAPGLPFGGVGNSGMGAYHGKAGFDTFTHDKSILSKGTWLDLPFRYQPLTAFKKSLLRMFLR